MSISILILTRNEERNLPECLRSVGWSDDLVVLDSFSSDRTVEIAREAGARVLIHEFVNFAEQRNFGLRNGSFKYKWVLHIDADERVTPELHAEMIKAISNCDKDAYNLPSRMMLQGRWLKHSGLYPSYQVRLGKRDRLFFVQVGHGQREALGPERIGTLKCSLIHHSFSKGIHDWINRHNGYSTDEAVHFHDSLVRKPLDWTGVFAMKDEVRQRRALKHLFFYMPFRPALRFLYMYLFRLGILDGLPGYHYCCLLSLYEYMIVLKMKEIRLQEKGLVV